MKRQPTHYIYENGTEEWYLTKEKFNFFGVSGFKAKYHRLDGPAIKWANGNKKWYIYGKELPTSVVEEWLEENNVNLKTIAGQMAFKLRWM